MYFSYTCDKPDDLAGICVRIGSISAGTTNNPLACETGLLNFGGTACASKYDEVVIDSSNNNNVEKYTSRGLEFKNYANATRHFNSWLEASTYDDDTEDEDAIYEAYRYTRNKKKINELWFRYVASDKVEDADECAYDYFWKHNSGNYIQFSFLIIALTLLF